MRQSRGQLADEQDDFAVKDDKGVPVVIVKGKAMSWRDRKSEPSPSTSPGLTHI